MQTGDHLLAVQAGSSLTSVFGQCRTEVKKGNSELSVHSGGHITQADKTVHVESRSADLQLHAKGPWVGKSEADLRLVAAEIKQDANEITLSALRKITLMVGPSSLTIDPSGVSISGPEVSSTALGTQTISGALVRIN